MIPETNIINAIDDIWVEYFPGHSATDYPKGLVKRVSMVAIKNKSGIVSGQYSSRMSIIWFDVNSTNFDSKMNTIITAMDTIKTDANITAVAYDGRTDLVDPDTKMQIMSLDFIVKHFI